MAAIKESRNRLWDYVGHIDASVDTVLVVALTFNNSDSIVIHVKSIKHAFYVKYSNIQHVTSIKLDVCGTRVSH